MITVNKSGFSTIQPFTLLLDYPPFSPQIRIIDKTGIGVARLAHDRVSAPAEEYHNFLERKGYGDSSTTAQNATSSIVLFPRSRKQFQSPFIFQ